MRILLSQPTTIGTFYLGQSSDRKYHPIFNDESLGSYSSVQDAVDSLLNNKVPVLDNDTNKLVDTSTLDIPENYIEWDSVY